MSQNIVDKKKNHHEDDKTKSRALNSFLWIIVALVVAVAALGNVYFTDEISTSIRVVAIIVLLVIALGLVAVTNQGRKALGFFKESKIELRKIVWPTRQEATQTTLIVMAVTVVVALVLWGLDSIVMSIITFLTDLRF
ncbi:protein translocase subunit secE/sec61 gamma [Volucribacter psittacicida]|uniref:Protein translocase subunit SecE n=1 Tax=Volucribacter psittacicida TaxID=203482 RepID=A0A4R1FN49_9PAST|nr:preprotein translocase subunit SecE [Volucribacter psittacicida]TCJ94769.1 protein translocase subunit secE/sec61 gamma [Volucribacter psittacicida]